jgi:hypothetical protein
MTFDVDLRTNIRKYLERTTTKRTAIIELLNSVTANLSDTLIFGGMLREFALKNGRQFSSDIDLVAMVSHKELYDSIVHFNPEQNKFGGFRFSIEKILIDIWAFEDTWAFREGFVKGRGIEDLLKTTFFNVDAVAYNLSTGELFYSEDWARGIHSRILDINLLQNPSIEKMARKAIKMACVKEFSIGSALAKFLIDNIEICDLNQTEYGFMVGLKKHVEYGHKTPYLFDPQLSLLA